MGNSPSRRKQKTDMSYQAPVSEQDLVSALKQSRKKGQSDDQVHPIEEGETADTAGHSNSEKKPRKREAIFQEDEQVVAKVAEHAEDHSGTIMRTKVEFFDDVLVEDTGYTVTKAKKNHVHYLINRKFPNEEYFYRAVADWPTMEHYLVPADWQGIAIQFKAPDAQITIHDKIIDRYHFLVLLNDLDITPITRERIEHAWDTTKSKHITSKEEPLLQEFEAASVLSFYREMDQKDPRERREMIGKNGRYATSVISLNQAGKIVMESILREASSYEVRQAAHTTHGVGSVEGMERMRKKREQAERRIAKKNVGQLGRMKGTKGDIKQIILALRDFIKLNFSPVLDEVCYFEWHHTREGAIMRRNAAWEFLYALDCSELVRPLELMRKVSTLNTERPNFSIAASEEGHKARKRINARTWEIRHEEETRFCLSRWLRAKTEQAVHVARFQDSSDCYDPANRRMQEEFGLARAQLAAETARANRRAEAEARPRRTYMPAALPALEERLRQLQLEESQRPGTLHMELLDALDGLREPDD